MRMASLLRRGSFTPVEVLGLSAPNSGDEALVVANGAAKRWLNLNQARTRREKIQRQQATKLEQMFSKMGSEEVQTLNVSSRPTYTVRKHCVKRWKARAMKKCR